MHNPSPGNHLRTRERLRARGGADEGRRVYERGDGAGRRVGASRGRAAGAVARRRRCWTGTVARGHRIRARPGGTRAAVEKARAGRRGRGRGPGRAAPGADGEGGIEGIEGVRGWASWPREMGGLGSSAGAGEREGGRGRGAAPVRGRATVAGETRQFAVGHGRAGRSRGAVTMEGASRGIDQLAVGPGPASTPNGAPRRDRGTSGRVTRGPAAGGWTAVSEQYNPCPCASTSTCAYIYIYVCVCMCVCMYV